MCSGKKFSLDVYPELFLRIDLLFSLLWHYWQIIQQKIRIMQAEKCECCPKGSWPALQTHYEAKGQTFQLGGTTVYHIGDSNKILIIISDIFGATSGRHRNVADTFASLGYNVYLPEILVDPYNGDMDMPKIVENIKSQSWQTMENRFAALWQFLKDKEYNEFFCVGFCWGVYTAFKFAGKYDGFKAIAGMHPSLGVAGIFGENQLDLTKAIKCPAFLYPAGNDPANIKVGGEHVKILAERFGQDKTGTLQFPDQIHGWVVRSDVSQEVYCKAVEKAIKHSHEYFSKF